MLVGNSLVNDSESGRTSSVEHHVKPNVWSFPGTSCNLTQVKVAFVRWQHYTVRTDDLVCDVRMRMIGIFCVFRRQVHARRRKSKRVVRQVIVFHKLPGCVKLFYKLFRINCQNAITFTDKQRVQVRSEVLENSLLE